MNNVQNVASEGYNKALQFKSFPVHEVFASASKAFSIAPNGLSASQILPSNAAPAKPNSSSSGKAEGVTPASVRGKTGRGK